MPDKVAIRQSHFDLWVGNVYFLVTVSPEVLVLHAASFVSTPRYAIVGQFLPSLAEPLNGLFKNLIRGNTGGQVRHGGLVIVETVRSGMDHII